MLHNEIGERGSWVGEDGGRGKGKEEEEEGEEGVVALLIVGALEKRKKDGKIVWKILVNVRFKRSAVKVIQGVLKGIAVICGAICFSLLSRSHDPHPLPHHRPPPPLSSGDFFPFSPVSFSLPSRIVKCC